MNAKSKLKVLAMAVAVAASVSAEVLTDQDFKTVIHTAGSSVWPAVSGNNKNGSQNNAFDGIRFSTDTGKRWLSSFKDFGYYGDGSGKDGVYAQMLAPDEFLGRIYLKKYRFYLLSCGGQEKDRAPKAWKVFGVPKVATDSSDWTELDSRSGYTSWTKPTEETPNEFAIADDKIAGAGFRAFRFMPTDSVAKPWSNTPVDFGLMEIEFVVDVYRNVTVATEIPDAFRKQGDYSPALGTAFDGVTTLTAPTYVENGGKTYVCAGHRIDEQQGDRWVTVETVEDGQNSFSYAPAEDPNAVRRVVWLWRESPVPVDFGPVNLFDLFADWGLQLKNSAYDKNVYTSGRYLFNGVTGGSSVGERWLAYLGADGGCYAGIGNLDMSMLLKGDLFYLSKYTLYMLSNGSNESKRVPTDWTLTGSTSTDGARSVIDERTGVSWTGKTTSANAYEFTPAHPEIGFADIRFTPTASAGYTNPDASTISVGLMELQLCVNMANPPGTLRVFNGGDVLNEGFSVASKALLTESATVTAPEYAIGSSGARRYAVTGYRLEKFNLEKTVWELVEEVKDTRTYAFTPDASAGYRLTWTHAVDGQPNLWQLTVNASGESCIRNGNWEFVVEEETDGTLKMSDKGYRAGSGELDLNVPILDGTGNEKSISIIGSRVIDGENDSSLRGLLTALVLPSNVWKIATRPFRNMTALTKVDMRCPELTYLGECAFTRDTGLKTLLFDAPKLTTFTYGYTFYNVPLAETDVAGWNLPALETLPMDAFRCESTAGQIARGCGVLTLPALCSVGDRAFAGHTGFAELRLGTVDGKLSAIGEGAFSNMAITNLVIGSKSSLTVAANACAMLNGGAGVGSLVFLKNAPADRTAVDSLLAGHGSSNLATLKVSKDYPQWNAYVTPTAEIADTAIKAAAVAAGADGAWRSTDGGDWLALVWRISTGFRPNGMAVIVR